MADLVSLNKVLVPKAALICQDIELDQQALTGLASDPSPLEFLQDLIKQKLYPDAVRFLARALPKREAVWWACLSARSCLLTEKPEPKLVQAVEAAEAWVYKPTETNRRQAFTAAEAASFENPAAWAGMGAFWSEGSMAPENVPAVPPADNFTAKAVAGAVMLAAVQSQPEKASDKYLFFLEQGIDIANGGNGRLWPG
ncbi:DUF6931 family protein [Methylomonas methanica]|uniref:Putative secreted protein n=1 Tax=Methylomonas methanica (strain DSM 25384 / MC09) TaxID=857087 RepID=F9ZYL0_METMM|nr:hypothetical protein [Methylomonas methanica]AEG02282.1 putative secreted protein [Methylomonas methanica MC09]